MPENAFRSSVIPGMRYRNAPEAIEWLCSVFGLAKHLVVPGPSNTIMHAELTLGGGMIMLGSWQYGQFAAADAGSVNLVVSDADEVYERAQASGAEIVLDIEDKLHGGRGFACRDLEGHLWHVGTYDPWQHR